MNTLGLTEKFTEVEIEMTNHGYGRVKERGKLKGKKALNSARKAYSQGKEIEDFPKEAQRYLNNVLQRSDGDTLKVWGNQIYLFGNDKLITVFPFPPELQRKMHRQRKHR